MRWIWMMGCLPGMAWAADVEIPVQARLLDTNGTPINGDRALSAKLCPNATPQPGEVCTTISLGLLNVRDGFVSARLGEGGGLDHHVFDVAPLWLGWLVDGQEMSPREPLQPPAFAEAGMLHLGTAEESACSAGENIGAITFRNGLVRLCDGTSWRALSLIQNIEAFGAGRRWSDGSYARSCREYLMAPAGYAYLGETGDGVYTISPDGGTPVDVLCDMTDGGWTQWAANDFESAAPSGWSDNSTYVCDGDTVHGGYGNNAWSAGNSVQRVFDLRGAPHTVVRYEARLGLIDSWDDEYVYIDLDGTQRYSRQHHFNDSGTVQICGNPSQPTWKDFWVDASLSASHSASTLTVRFRNNLNGTDATNESVSQARYELWFR